MARAVSQSLFSNFFVVGLECVERKCYSDLKGIANERLNEKTGFEQICVVSKLICPMLFKVVERMKLCFFFTKELQIIL